MRKFYTDFVIVGAGTAGCILAARLSEDPKTKVILIEAGPKDRNPLIHIPIGFSKLLYNTSLNWGFETTPQSELRNRKIYWPRGKVLGGSSSINGLIWVRGDQGDYDAWAQATGDQRWSWANSQKFFLRCEAATDTADARLGRTGAIPLASTTVSNSAVDAFLAAGVAAGLQPQSSLAISDTNSVGAYLLTSRGGRRVSSAVAYLKDGKKRENLIILENTQVSRVLFDKDVVATGVLGVSGTTELEITANRGVILAAGAVNSPHLLMLSGIGDAAALKKHGIPVRINSRDVGQNLRDHFGTRLIAKIKPAVTINSDFRRPWRLAANALRYAFTRKGPLSMGGAYAGAFFSHNGAQRPTMQIHFLPLSMQGKGWNFHKFSGVTANVMQLRPKSHGTLTLRSANHHDAPLIDPKYLSDPEDQRDMVEGVKYVRSILRSATFAGPMQAIDFAPDLGAESDADILGYIRDFGGTVYHPVGSCRMGADAGSVVTSTGEVRGAHRLWVVDASIMPTMPSGNTNAATAMIAEQLSDVIKHH